MTTLSPSPECKTDDLAVYRRLCGLSAEVRRMFELGAFLDVFAICGTREEGLAKAK